MTLDQFRQQWMADPSHRKYIKGDGSLNIAGMARMNNDAKNADIAEVDDGSGFHLDNNGQVKKNDSLAKFIVGGLGLALGGPLLGQALTGGGAAASVAGGSSAGGSAAAGGAGTTMVGGIPTTMGLPTGLSTGATSLGTLSAGTTLGGKSILDRLGGFLGGKKGDLLQMGGKAISDATTAAGKNRIDRENMLEGRSKLEEGERASALRDIYRAGWYGNRQASPNNTRGLQPMSPQFMQTMQQMADRAQGRIPNMYKYGVEQLPDVNPGVLERIGSWAGPIMTGVGALGKL